MKSTVVKAQMEMEMVVVAVHGCVLDFASFGSRGEAVQYKGHVRRWAFERGVRAEIWNLGAEARRDPHCGPVALAMTAA